MTSEEQFEELIKESEKLLAKAEKRQEDGVADILKYFDRIHDNLSNYNNLLIGAFFALGQFQKEVPRWTILIPLANLCLLIYINYRLMQKARFEADSMNKTPEEIRRYGKSINSTNLLSLLSIVSTGIVTIIFLWWLRSY